MPSIMHVSERTESLDTYDRTQATLKRPVSRRARPGCWRLLAHKLSQYLTPTPWPRHAPSGRGDSPGETSMDRLVREYPSFVVSALALL
jgi:hypothetical protein